MRQIPKVHLKKSQGLSGAVLALLLLSGALYPADATAYSPDGYPGSVWGSLTRGFDNTEGTGVQGWARQGVRWARFGGGLDLNTYAAYNWRLRTRNKTYYNTNGPSLIAVLEKGPFSAGAEFAWLRYPDLPLNTKDYSLFATWYASRDISRLTGLPSLGTHSPLALPLSTWGRMSYDLQGVEGSGSQGWVRQGVDWLALGKSWKFNTYAAYNWRLRSKNKTYYDVHGPSLGAAFNGKYCDVGAEYYWQRFPQLNLTAKTFNIYFNWYYNWDLKKK